MNVAGTNGAGQRVRRLVLVTTILVVGIAALDGVAGAAAAPLIEPELHTQPTHLPPGGQGDLWLNLQNISDEPAPPGLEVTWQLPPGLTADSVHTVAVLVNDPGVEWDCGSVGGASTFTCTSLTSLPARSFTQALYLTVNVAPDASGVVHPSVTVTGGGTAAPVTESENSQVDPVPASFGVVPGTFEAGFFKADGVTPETRAGSHPYEATFAFDVNSVKVPNPSIPNTTLPAENLRDLKVDLPPGFGGDPTALGECTQDQLTQGECPGSSQVGMIRFNVGGCCGEEWRGYYLPVFNMEHPKGVVADLAFSVQGNPIHIKASLDSKRNYAIRTTVSNINETLPIFDQKLTIWGFPGDHRHDLERTACGGGTGCTHPGCPAGGAPCPYGGPPKPFITIPEQCDEDAHMTLSGYDSWQNRGVFGPPVDTTLPGHFTGCDSGRFSPDVTIHPTNQRADSPTGLEITAHVPQNSNANAVATPQVKAIHLKFPEGLSVNPAFSDGLDGCTEAQAGISETAVPDESAANCPDNSRIGSVTLRTPVLPKPLEGSIYLAKQTANPYGSLLAMYVVVHDTEERGILVKIPGRLDLDPATGQISSSFDDLPQFPVEDLIVSFRSGARAPLVNPATCGSKKIEATLNTYAQPSLGVDASSSYSITEGPSGGPCSPTSESRPFAPELAAGTQSPLAAIYSPFTLQLTRQDGEQEITELKATLPPGLTARLAGVPYCSDATIASIPTALGTGRGEKEHPSCPAASRIGSVYAGSGVGPQPYYIPGSAYLAGPYQGAPLSVAVVTPAVAGGVDLGNIVVRSKLEVDPITAQVTVDSGPIPTIVHGVPLHLRDIRVNVDRSGFSLNPTSCASTDVAGVAMSSGSQIAPLRSHFQVGGCRGLDFAPKLRISLKGKTKRSGNPVLKAVLTQPAGQANIGRASVVLPATEFIDNRHINNPCTRVQFNAGAGNGSECPSKSILGHARAYTPLLDQPLEGPVYFRSNGGERQLPDLVAALHGQVDVNLVGFIDSVHKKGAEVSRVRNTFAMVPDVPVGKFVLELAGGKRGLLQNSANLCKRKNLAQIKFAGHNGTTDDYATALRTPCHGKAQSNHRSRR